MKRIIIPTDFSEAAWDATLYGLEFASKIQVEVLLLHAFRMPRAGASNLVSIIDEIRKDAEREMDSTLARLKSIKDYNIEINIRCFEGDVFDVLKAYCNNNGDDLILLGTLGASGLKRKLIGSTASQVIKSLDTPVLVIPPNIDFNLDVGISFAIDENTTINSSDFYWVKLLYELNNQNNIQVVNIIEDEEINTPSVVKIPEELDSLNVEFVELVNNNVVEGLDEFIQSSETNCLVLVRRNLNFFEKLFKFSVSRDLSVISKCPLLVIRSSD